VTTFISPRLRNPAVSAMAGVLFAAAWLMRGGPLWWVAIMSVVVAAARVITLYRMGGQDTHEGALAASRADERQKLLNGWSRALACSFAVVTAFVLPVTIAVKSPALAIPGRSRDPHHGYLSGLSSYGADDQPDAMDDAGTSHHAPSPVR
jgi:hypothetical protein